MISVSVITPITPRISKFPPSSITILPMDTVSEIFIVADTVKVKNDG